MNKIKNISIRKKVYEKLKDYTEEEGFSNFDDSILFLLKLYSENGARQGQGGDQGG